jgi:hypothetical protein
MGRTSGSAVTATAAPLDTATDDDSVDPPPPRSRASARDSSDTVGAARATAVFGNSIREGKRVAECRRVHDFDDNM